MVFVYFVWQQRAKAAAEETSTANATAKAEAEATSPIVKPPPGVAADTVIGSRIPVASGETTPAADNNGGTAPLLVITMSCHGDFVGKASSNGIVFFLCMHTRMDGVVVCCQASVMILLLFSYAGMIALPAQ